MIFQCGLIAATIFTAILYWILFEGRKNRPPGPWGLPIFGYLLFLNEKKPHESLADIAWRYGPVCSLRMGAVYTVLITDPKIMRKAFAQDEVTGRAPLYLTHGIMKGYGLIASEGLIWKEHRRFIIQNLKNLGMVKNASSKRDELETKISLFVDEAVSKLEKRTDAESGLEPHDTLHHCIGNFMNSIVLGKTYDEDDELWKWLQLIQEEGVKHIGVSGPLNFLPLLRFFPNYMKTMNLIIDGQKKTHDVYRDIMREYSNTGIDSGPAPNECNSILAYYVKQMKDIQSNASVAYPELYSETQMYYLLADMYGAGVDTTLTTLRWFLLFMAAYPSEQAKVHEEMDAVLGDKMPTLCDRPLLIRFEAAMMESQRLRSVVPTGIPHGTTKATQIEGYDIPKGTMVMPLLWGIHLNPKYFPDPLHYMPDRFIAEDGSLVKPEAFVPFQLGNRMCPGLELARIVLFLFGARILHRFQLAAPSDQPIDLEGEAGITLVPKAQKILFQPRL